MLLKRFYIYIISIFILLGCGSDGKFKTIATEVIVSGMVSKGPISGSHIDIKQPDTGAVLGSGTTDSKGHYSIEISMYSGIVKIISTGGSYIDEIDGLKKDATQVVLNAYSIIDKNEGYSVNITPFTEIASKNIELLDVIDKNSTINENKKVAFLFMGSEFDITKVTPKILKIDTIDDSNEGKYGTMLAVFSKLTDSNSSKIDLKLSELYSSYQDGVIDENISNQIQIALQDTNITSLVDSAIIENLEKVSKEQGTIQRIKNYAQDSNNTKPTLQDYTDIGLEDLTDELVMALNIKIDQVGVDEVDTLVKIKSVLKDIAIVPVPPAPSVKGAPKTFHTDLNISGNCNSGDTITAFLNEVLISPTTNCLNKSFFITPDLTLVEGNHTISITATDDANNTSLQSAITALEIIPRRAFITTWKTDNNGTTDDNQIKIGTNGVDYNYTVEWGDGESNSSITGDINHTYSAVGIYRVEVSGKFPQIYFADIGYDNDKIISINQWGDTEWKSMFSAFYKCRNLEINATDKPNLTYVKTLSNMFNGALSFDKNISDWNISSIEDMTHMLKDVNISTENYDALLKKWSSLTVENNVTFDAGVSKYSVTVQTNRDTLTNSPNDWNITDGGQE